MDDSNIYHVVDQKGKSNVIDKQQNVVVSCHDHNNAQHYAQLMNQAYRHGYKKGFRDAKK